MIPFNKSHTTSYHSAIVSNLHHCRVNGRWTKSW